MADYRGVHYIPYYRNWHHHLSGILLPMTPVLVEMVEMGGMMTGAALTAMTVVIPSAAVTAVAVEVMEIIK